MRSTRAAIALAVAATTAGVLAIAPPAQAAGGGDQSATPEVPQYSWSNVAISGGGYVPGIIYNDTEPGLVYARTDIGGAYRLDRDTDTWIPLLDGVGWDDWNRLGVLSLATDPVHTSRVYAAVGSYTNEWDPNNGAILRSSDYGTSWKATELPFKVGGNMPGRGIGERLQIDPNDDDILYYGAEQGEGLWRSDDAGVTFEKVDAFPNAGDFVPDAGSGNSYLMSNLGVLWTAFDQASSSPGSATKTIFTAVADTDDILYRSDDAGTTWTAVKGAPTGFLPQHGVIDETGRFLYLTTTDTSGPYDGADGAVWRYGIDDGTWTDITPTQRPTGGDFGFSGLTIDAQHPGTVMVASQIQWWPDTLIFRSTDSGATWSPMWDYAYDAAGNATVAAKYTQSIDEVPWLAFGKTVGDPTPWTEPTPKVGWMVSALAIDPFDSNELLYGTGATIYRSEDLTKWDDDGGVIHLQPATDGIEETAIQDVVAPVGDVDLVSAMLDLGGFVHDDIDEVTNTFQDPYFGGATSVDAAGRDGATIVRAGTDGTGAIETAVSHDGGDTWTSSPAADGATGSGTVTVNADGTGVVWAPDGAPAQHSADGGRTWGATTGLPEGARVESDRVDTTLVYGFSGGVFYRSTDAGASFTAVSTSTLPAEGSVRFGAMPGAIGELWLAGGEDDGVYGMWRSDDAGASWTRAPGFDEADTVGFGKAAPGAVSATIYTAARRDGVRGVYRSTNDGATWTRINDDDHQWGAIGADIEGDPDLFGRVYIATNGRGIVVGDDAEAAPDPWSASARYDTGDVVSCDGSFWVASWWTSGQKPGDVNGPWQQIVTADTGVATWTASRIFDTGDVVTHNGALWRAKWWTRDQEPGATTWGPWERVD
ncbi:xyloglucanase [Microbacterium protaetiae]|uniref:Xyloglucanase n=1 Tax=Microbacterium protaetiae TaxID=2509458 RepID=A0A4P6EEP0_9MICO|nr:carbohydrate-binding protein [Microbacterium protaetiae]QAY60792.1 xyloglucanase [Microbacterium protaetiae]